MLGQDNPNIPHYMLLIAQHLIRSGSVFFTEMLRLYQMFLNDFDTPSSSKNKNIYDAMIASRRDFDKHAPITEVYYSGYNGKYFPSNTLYHYGHVSPYAHPEDNYHPFKFRLGPLLETLRNFNPVTLECELSNEEEEEIKMRREGEEKEEREEEMKVEEEEEGREEKEKVEGEGEMEKNKLDYGLDPDNVKVFTGKKAMCKKCKVVKKHCKKNPHICINIQNIIQIPVSNSDVDWEYLIDVL